MSHKNLPILTLILCRRRHRDNYWSRHRHNIAFLCVSNLHRHLCYHRLCCHWWYYTKEWPLHLPNSHYHTSCSYSCPYSASNLLRTATSSSTYRALTNCSLCLILLTRLCPNTIDTQNLNFVKYNIASQLKFELVLLHVITITVHVTNVSETMYRVPYIIILRIKCNVGSK